MSRSLRPSKSTDYEFQKKLACLKLKDIASEPLINDVFVLRLMSGVDLADSSPFVREVMRHPDAGVGTINQRFQSSKVELIIGDTPVTVKDYGVTPNILTFDTVEKKQSVVSAIYQEIYTELGKATPHYSQWGFEYELGGPISSNEKTDVAIPVEYVTSTELPEMKLRVTYDPATSPSREFSVVIDDVSEFSYDSIGQAGGDEINGVEVTQSIDGVRESSYEYIDGLPLDGVKPINCPVKSGDLQEVTMAKVSPKSLDNYAVATNLFYLGPLEELDAGRIVKITAINFTNLDVVAVDIPVYFGQGYDGIIVQQETFTAIYDELNLYFGDTAGSAILGGEIVFDTALPDGKQIQIILGGKQSLLDLIASFDFVITDSDGTNSTENVAISSYGSEYESSFLFNYSEIQKGFALNCVSDCGIEEIKLYKSDGGLASGFGLMGVNSGAMSDVEMPAGSTYNFGAYQLRAISAEPKSGGTISKQFDGLGFNSHRVDTWWGWTWENGNGSSIDITAVDADALLTVEWL